jgi:pSer/pThr/pTyr-binding forkhead associated (FHA) protein
MNLSIEALNGPVVGRVIEIRVKQFLIGRDPGCHLRPVSARISKRHCALLQRDGKAFIRDFGSINGTFVNGLEIRAVEIELHDGDQVRIGPLLFAVHLEPFVRLDDDKEAAMLKALQEIGMVEVGQRTAAPDVNTVLDLSVGTLTDKEKEKPK